MTPPHIALITPGFPADEGDTPCIPALQDYVIELRRQFPDTRLHVVTQRYPDRRGSYHWHGIPVDPIGARHTRASRAAATWYSLARAARRHGAFTAVHSFWPGECGRLGRLWARATGVRHVLTLMGQEVRAASRALRILGRQGTRVVAVSGYQDAVLRSVWHRGADCVIPWGVGTMPSPRARREFDVVALASLTSVKAPERFVRVVAQIAAVRPDLRACWIGEGVLRDEAEALSIQCGLGERLCFLGGLDRQQALAVLGRAHVLLHSAEYESFCMALVEARALGVATVSRRVGVAGDAGWEGPAAAIVDAEPAMVDAVLRLLAAPPPAPQHDYPIEKTAKAYHALYTD